MQITERNGKYQYREYYFDRLTGKRKRATITLEKNTKQAQNQARELLRQKIAEINNAPVTSDLTLGELYAAYIEDKKKDGKKTTVRVSETMTRPVVDAIGRDVLVSRLNAPILRSGLGDEQTPNLTKNNRLRHVKTMLRWAYRNELIESVSFLDRVQPYKTESSEELDDKFLERDELEKLIDSIQQEQKRLIVQVLVLTGMRIGELAALRKTDIDMQKRLIHINKTWDCTAKESTSTKTTASKRSIFIQDELLPVLTAVKKWRLQNGKATDYFLPDYDGDPIHVPVFQTWFCAQCERVLGKHMSPHCLRHTHASLCFEGDMGVEAVKERLGHENSAITQALYIHITERKKAQYNQQLNKISFLT